MSVLNLAIVSVLGLFISCSEDDDITGNDISSCDSTVVIDSEQFTNTSTDNVTINSFSIENDCLTVNFSAGGCDGSTWITELIDSEQVFLPPHVGLIDSNLTSQRMLSFVLEDNEECEAFITQEVSFDISTLQVEGESSVELFFSNSTLISSIIYVY